MLELNTRSLQITPETCLQAAVDLYYQFNSTSSFQVLELQRFGRQWWCNGVSLTMFKKRKEYSDLIHSYERILNHMERRFRQNVYVYVVPFPLDRKIKENHCKWVNRKILKTSRTQWLEMSCFFSLSFGTPEIWELPSLMLMSAPRVALASAAEKEG